MYSIHGHTLPATFASLPLQQPQVCGGECRHAGGPLQMQRCVHQPCCFALLPAAPSGSASQRPRFLRRLPPPMPPFPASSPAVFCLTPTPPADPASTQADMETLHKMLHTRHVTYQFNHRK